MGGIGKRMTHKGTRFLGFGASVIALALAAGVVTGAGSAGAKSKDTSTEPKTAAKTEAKRATHPTASIPLPRPRPQPLGASASAHATPAAPAPAHTPTAHVPAPSIPSGDMAVLKEAITLARNGKIGPVTDMEKGFSDPLPRKLVEWTLLRSDNNPADFYRYAAFLSANPGWPSIKPLRRKAEAALWQEQAEPATVRGFLAKEPPLSAKGHFALARALLAMGDRAGAQAQVRETWRNEAFSADLEEQVLQVFGGFLTAADQRARMDMRFYAEDVEAGLRAANRAGGTAPAVAKAWVAVIRKAGNAKALLDGIPSEASRDLGYTFARVQWLRRADKAAE